MFHPQTSHSVKSYTFISFFFCTQASGDKNEVHLGAYVTFSIQIKLIHFREISGAKINKKKAGGRLPIVAARNYY